MVNQSDKKIPHFDDEREFPSLSSQSHSSSDDDTDTPSFNAADDMVTFKIGKGKTLKKFIIHKEVACKGSPVLKAAFNSSFIEGQTGIYCLEDTTEGAFRLLTQWMYTKHVKFLREPERATSGEMAKDELEKEKKLSKRRLDEDVNLVALWILADRLCMGKLQNYVICGLTDRGRVCSRAAWVYVYENTAIGSPLRQLLAIQFAWMAAEPEDFDQYVSIMPYEMLGDIIRVFREALPEQRRAKNERNIFYADFYVAED